MGGQGEQRQCDDCGQTPDAEPGKQQSKHGDRRQAARDADPAERRGAYEACFCRQQSERHPHRDGYCKRRSGDLEMRAGLYEQIGEHCG